MIVLQQGTKSLGPCEVTGEQLWEQPSACRRQESPTLRPPPPPPPKMQLRGGGEEAAGINLFSILLPRYYKTHLGGEGRGRSG